MLNLGLVFFPLFFVPATQAAPLSPADEAVSIVSDYTPGLSMDLDRLKILIQSDVDVNTRDPGGENLVNLAAESWAYIASSLEAKEAYYTQANAEAAFNTVEFLVQNGADVSSGDGSGQTPLLHIVRYGPSDISKMFDLFMSKSPDLNLQLLGFNESLSYSLVRGSRLRELQIAVSKGLRLTDLDARDASIVHWSASARRITTGAAAGVLPLEATLNLLSPADQARLADHPDHSGLTPLMNAVRGQNLEGARYLLDHFTINLAAKTVEDETPLSIALETGNQDMIALLRARGAPEPVEGDPSKIICDGPNAPPVDYEKLQAIIQTCRLASMEGLLPLLPRELRANYTLAYHTFAAQKATADFPQAVLFGRTGKLLLAFNGSPDEAGFQDLELIQFRDQTKQFELRFIEFPKDGKGSVTFSEANPSRCTGCHGVSPRPFWDNWTFWPGKFQGEQQRFYPLEYSLWQRYLKNRHSGRYQYLLEEGQAPLRTARGLDAEADAFNMKLDVLTGDLLAQKAVREMARAPALKPYRYAILAALSCQEDPRDFLTPAAAQALPRKLEDVTKETYDLGFAETQTRLLTLAQLLPGAPQGRYDLDHLRHPTSFRSYPSAGRSFDPGRVARLRYLVEGLGVPMADWFSGFDLLRARYVTSSLEPFALYGWRELLDPQADAEIYGAYQKLFQAFVASDRAPYAGSFVYRTANEQRLCPLLKKASLAALAR